MHVPSTASSGEANIVEMDALVSPEATIVGSKLVVSNV
jgi:hypothetical protein